MRSLPAFRLRGGFGGPSTASAPQSFTCDDQTEFLADYFEDHAEAKDLPFGADKAMRRKAAALVNTVFETIRNYQVAVVVIERDSNLEAVCRIFETINSTATRLTTFDLAVARFFSTDGGLDLREAYDQSLSKHHQLKRFEVDGERVMQVLALWRALDEGQYVEATRSAILGLPKAFIDARWDSAVASLDSAYAWAEAHGALPRWAPQEGILVALAAFFGLSATPAWRARQTGFDATLERWFFAKLLQQGARQAANYKTAQDLAALMEWQKGGQLVPSPVDLTTDDIIGLTKSDVRYRTMHAILMLRSKVDLLTGDQLGADAEDHHIFPASFEKKHHLTRSRLESIANKLLVSPATNRRLSDDPPAKYMSELRSEVLGAGTTERVSERLAWGALPPTIQDAKYADRYDVSRFAFLKERANLLRSLVAQILGDALRDASVVDGDDE
jgi:hypothetical protein